MQRRWGYIVDCVFYPLPWIELAEPWTQYIASLPPWELGYTQDLGYGYLGRLQNKSYYYGGDAGRGEYLSNKIWNCLSVILGYIETVCYGAS